MFIILFLISKIGLFVGPLSQMRSHRWTTSVGIFLMGTGAILSSFAQSNSDIYLSVGLLSGMHFMIWVVKNAWIKDDPYDNF